MTTETKAKVQEGGAPPATEAPKPRIQDSPEFKEALSAATSKDQRRLAEANKKLKTAGEQITSLGSRITQIEHDAEVARIGGDDEGSRDSAKKLLDLKQQLEKRAKDLQGREERVTGLERQMTIKSLAAEHGIPEDELEECETAAEMVEAALRFALGKAKSTQAKGATETEPERESKKVEASDGRVAGRKIPDPITQPKEYAEYLVAVRASPDYRSRIR